ncbi:hypothetical protein DEU56DRAFT_64844 [Suillus clintonianus]|uniref:uncharacterized protein n=1 Tax=Suillus clintonianus TaxID=1904413 RepID=UPI001B882DD4|nr:uncharacterized protein DEU56DRAFT_64844 [Suillus clintonianus]KAG2123067.1 hypothetical protein DEU56DRAFT_64844 [Suillus clintonianus]
MATFWAYEYVKGIYIVTRYVPFLLLTMNLYTGFSPHETPSKCRILVNVCSGFSIISGICSQYFFALRTCALWNNNRIVVITMLSLCLAFIVASISISFDATATAPYATSKIPGITGCYQIVSSVQLFIPFLLFFAVEMGLMTLTLIRAIQSWRVTNNHLYVVLLKHNIYYYACGLLFSVANIFISLLLHYAYHGMLHDFQFVILAILATNMHRHLWQMDLHVHTSDAPVRIHLSDMSDILYAGHTV